MNPALASHTLDLLRERLLAGWPPQAESRRLLHGRGRCFPGLEALTIDWYRPILFVTCYAQLPLAPLQSLYQSLLQASPELLQALVVQTRLGGQTETRVLDGVLPARPLAREAGLKFLLQFDRGQNIGFFPDMAAGRALLRQFSRDRRVLNLFAYSCSLSVAALKGGARQVVNLDMSRNALELGRQNHLLNAIDPRKVSFLPHDLFKSFSRLRKLGPFDTIVIDPPLAQGQSFQAERDWPKILRRLPELLVPGGEVFACVSAPELGRSFLSMLFERQLPGAELLDVTTAGPDFPEADPDKGLQVLRYRLR